MINSVCGKTMENLRKRINVRLVNNEKQFLKHTSRPSHVTRKIFGENYANIHEVKPIVTLNKLIYVGFTVLLWIYCQNQDMFMMNFSDINICLISVAIRRIQSFLMTLIKELFVKRKTSLNEK